MYRVRVTVNLLGNNGLVGLSRWLELPFVPFPGLDLLGLTTGPNAGEVVEVVAWDVAGKCFHAELLDCESPEETVAELLDYYGPGWEIHEPGFEPGFEPVQDPDGPC
jgi:hypothetical protein